MSSENSSIARHEMTSLRAGRRAAGRSRPEAGFRRFSLLLAVLVLGLSASGYFLASQQQALAEAEAARAQAEARLARIEDQLSLTGQALSETENETQSQINLGIGNSQAVGCDE